MSKKQKTVFSIIFGIVILGLFGVIMFHQLKHGDFPGYIQYAREFSANGYLYKIPHTLLERSIVIVRALLPANILVWISPMVKQIYDLKSFEISTLIVMVAAYSALAIILIKYIIREWNIREKSTLWFAGLATLLIMLVGPIFVFTIPDRVFMGYITGNRYDSPTYVLFRPFVVFVFLELVDNLFARWNWKKTLFTALAIFLATLGKPNFTLTIIPAVGFYLLFHLKEFKKVNWGYVLLGGGIPAFIVLLSQFVINYTGDRGDRLVIAPFRSILIHVPNLWAEAAFVILSIIFPLLILILYWKEVKERLDFRLAWVNFLVALVIGFILTEEIYVYNNNIWNCPMIAVFLLFMVSITWWGKGLLENIRLKKGFSGRQIATTCALALHLFCGIYFYIAILLSQAIMID